MALPEVTVTVSDGGLGVVGDAPDLDSVTFGVCSAGTTNTLLAFNDVGAVRTALGKGPLVEALAAKLAEPGHGTVYGVKVNASVAGSNSAVTASGGGPAVTLTGTPYDYAEGIVKITKGGAVGTSTFQFSLDGGDTWSADLTTAATYLLTDLGVTLNFAAGTYVLAETYSWTSTAPYYSGTDLTNAWNAVVVDPREWSIAHVVGEVGGADDSAKSTALASLFSTVDTLLQAAASTYFRYLWAVIEAPQFTADTAVATAFASLSSNTGRVSVSVGHAELVSQISGRILTRPAAWAAMARAAAAPISQDLAWVGAGKLNGIASLKRDEAKTPALDAARFMTYRTIMGQPGFYVTNPRTMATPTSDFGLAQYVRVVNALSRVVRNGALPLLSQGVRVDKITGKILEADAQAIERRLTALAQTVLDRNGHASDTQVIVDRSTNILSTRTLRIEARCVPLAYAKAIGIAVGFVNPTLIQTAA